VSGVCGCGRIPNRESFDYIVTDIQNTIKDLKGFQSITPTGSYKTKSSFGDIDIILEVDSTDKKIVKTNLIRYMRETNRIRPFVSEKYKGKEYYNSGEIVTFSYQSPGQEPHQVDFIISLTPKETEFKCNFLDLPAENQGLLLGLVKTVILEQPKRNIGYEELEYNLSSKELQLRKITYEHDISTSLKIGFKETKREIIGRYTDWDKVISLVDIDPSIPFDELIEYVKTLNNPRSIHRIKGLFKSMISVKSGEVNTPKGERKLECLRKVSEIR